MFFYTENFARLEDIICKNFNVDLVVQCVNIAKDSTTRNHALSLMTALGRLLPDQVLDHVIDIFTIMGESTIIQVNSQLYTCFWHWLPGKSLDL